MSDNHVDDDPEQLDRYVEDLLQDRKPERTSLGNEDALRARQVAGMLRAARPGASLPQPEFLEQMQRSIEESVGSEPQAASPSRGYSRRSLLLGGVSGIAAGILAALGIERATQQPRSAWVFSSPMVTQGLGTWKDVVAMADLPDGVPTRFSSGAIEGYLLRTGQDVRGMSAICTHMGCLLNWSKLRVQFECPCHGATFDVNGRPSSGYAAALPQIPTLQVRVTKGQVEVYTV